MKATIRIEEFCDLKKLEKMLDDWSVSTKMSVIIKDLNNNFITRPLGFSDYCKTLRMSEEAMINCANCQTDGGVFFCHAGLCDFSAPITLPDGTKVAEVICGQLRMSDSEIPDFKKIAEKYNIDPEKLEESFKNIEIKNIEEIDASRSVLINLINNFVERSYTKWIRRHQIADDRILARLTEILYSYNITLNPQTDEFTMIIGEGGMSRSVEPFLHFSKYSEAMREAIKPVHPTYIDKVRAFTDINRLKDRKENGFFGNIEYPVLFSGADSYEWHEMNVFAEKDDNGVQTINILVREVTEAHELQEKNNRELQAAAERNQVLSDLTKMLYNFNITLNLATGKYTLITGTTGMTELTEIIKSTNNYDVAYKKAVQNVMPKYVSQFESVASLEALRRNRSKSGFIDSIEYGYVSKEKEEWHEVNVFISWDNDGDTIANILGRDVTEAHKRQEQQNIAQRAAYARDQLLSGVTKCSTASILQ